MLIMKRILFFWLLPFFLNSVSLNAQWHWKSPYPQGNNIKNIFIGQNNSLFGIGDYGTLISSTNSGISWKVENRLENISEPIKTYFKFNDLIYFLISYGGKILKSTNSGSSWELYSQMPGNVDDIYFSSLDTGYAIVGRLEIVKTTDRGFTWNTIYISGQSFLNSIEFINNSTGFASGGAGLFVGTKLFKTTNGGNNWEQRLTTNSGDLFLKKFTDDSTGYGILYTKLYKTTDQGMEWNLLPNDYSNNCNDAFFFSEDSIISIHNGNTIRFTTNGGLNWVSNIIPEYSSNNINFINFNMGFVMGSNNRILSTIDNGNTWTYLTESNGSGTASNWLKEIAFVNINTGFVCGWNSYFRKTTDRGENWIPIQTGFNGHISDLDFVDEENGYLVGGNSGFTYVAKTTNGGLNFTQISSFDSYLANGIEFVNHKIGFILGNYSFYRTSNSGMNWSHISLSDTVQLYGIDFINEATGFVAGQLLYSSPPNRIYKTTNSGLNWQQMFSANNSFYNIDFVNDFIGYVVGRGIHKTTNAGENWFKLTSLTNNPFLAGIEFINENTGFVSGYGDMYRTTNGGFSWEMNTSLPTDVRLEEIIFFGNDTGIVIGDNGTILKTYNGGGNFITGVNNSNLVQQKNYLLSQNYPNPFNPKTIINYQLPASQGGPMFNFVSLKVYDALGKEVATLVNQKQNAGSYEVDFNGEELPSGVYFYKLETKNFSETKRMILLK